MEDIDKENTVVEIKGKFTKRGNTNKLVPAAGAYLKLTLTHDDEDVEFRVIDDEGDKIEYLGGSFLLDHDGSLPRDAYIRSTDEILPPGSSYFLEVEDTNARHHPTYYYKEHVEIKGDAAVDLTPPPELELEVFDLDAHLSPRERELRAVDAAIVRDGTMKFGKKNRIGFFAGSIHCPTINAGAVSLPSGENGEFGVFPFSLPFAVVVNRVSILVDTAAKGTVAIGIYDASGSKRCDASIDVSRSGLATGIFPNEVNLNEGDHFLAWRTDKVCNAQLRGIGAIDQLNLLNASGARLMGTSRSQPGTTTLPDTLGVIGGSTYAPILAHFKA